MRNTLLRKLAGTAAALTLATSLAACAGEGGAGTNAEDEGGGGGEGGGSGETITLGYIPSWTDGLSTAYLLENRLTEMGYNVEMEELTEPAPLYAGLANGDVDIYPSAWPEVTHKQYMDEYGDKIEDLDTYYDNAKLTMAVPKYTDISSIEDLKSDPGKFNGEIIGIEPGAGLTAAVKDQVIPDYGLDMTLKTSSTTAMLAELKKATEAKEDIVVTLWRPFWANEAFPVKDLEDPKGALGGSEGLHFLGTDGFSDEFPDAADFIGGIKLDDAQYGQLEDMVVNEYGEGKEAEAIDAWMEKNPDVLPTVE